MIFRNFLRSDRPLSDPGEARTLDPLIKSQLLYQLSYGVRMLLGWCISQMRCKGTIYFLMGKRILCVFLFFLV